MDVTFINTVATIIAAFFLLSLGVETLLENFRGLLAILGINVLKSKTTIDEALVEIGEFVPAESKEFVKFVGLANFLKNSDDSIAKSKTAALEVIAQAQAAVTPEARNDLISKLKLGLTAEAAQVRAVLEKSEEKRVFILRIISAAIGVGVCWAGGLNVLQIAHVAGQETPVFYEYFGYILGGLAAAGGSSFWHDQLDRVRSVKQVGQQLVAMNVAPAK